MPCATLHPIWFLIKSDIATTVSRIWRTPSERKFKPLVSVINGFLFLNVVFLICMSYIKCKTYNKFAQIQGLLYVLANVAHSRLKPLLLSDIPMAAMWMYTKTDIAPFVHVAVLKDFWFRIIPMATQRRCIAARADMCKAPRNATDVTTLWFLSMYVIVLSRICAKPVGYTLV